MLSGAFCSGLIEAIVVGKDRDSFGNRYPERFAPASLKLKPGGKLVSIMSGGYPERFAPASLKRFRRRWWRWGSGCYPERFAPASLKRVESQLGLVVEVGYPERFAPASLKRSGSSCSQTAR